MTEPDLVADVDSSKRAFVTFASTPLVAPSASASDSTSDDSSLSLERGRQHAHSLLLHRATTYQLSAASSRQVSIIGTPEQTPRIDMDVKQVMVESAIKKDDGLYPYWSTSVPEQVHHLGVGVALYFYQLKIFGIGLSAMSFFACFMMTMCWQWGTAEKHHSVFFRTGLGNYWAHGESPDLLYGNLDCLIGLIFLITLYRLPKIVSSSWFGMGGFRVGGKVIYQQQTPVGDETNESWAPFANHTTPTPSPAPSSFSVMLESLPPILRISHLTRRLELYGRLISITIITTYDELICVTYDARGGARVVYSSIRDELHQHVKEEEDDEDIKQDEMERERSNTGNNVQEALIPSPTIYDATYAFVTFDKPHAADACLNDMRGCLLWIPCLSRCPADSMCRTWPIKASRPHEPSDLLWSNLHTSPFFRTFLFLFSTIISAGVLFGNWLALWNLQKLRNLSHVSSSLAFIIGMGIVLFNELLKLILVLLARLERHHSHSSMETSISRRKFIVELTNNILVVHMIFGFPGSTADAAWYDSAGMIVIGILGADAIIPNLIQFIHPKTRLIRWYQRTTAKTQEQLNRGCEGPKMELWTRFAGLLGTFYITMWFASALPILVVIATINVFLSFWVEKYNVLRQYQRPTMLDASMPSFVMQILPVCILFHVAFAMIVLRDQLYEDLHWDHWNKNTHWPPRLTQAQLPILFLSALAVLFLLWWFTGGLVTLIRMWCCCCVRRSSHHTEAEEDELAKTKSQQKSYRHVRGIESYNDFAMKAFSINVNATKTS